MNTKRNRNGGNASNGLVYDLFRCTTEDSYEWSVVVFVVLRMNHNIF